MIHIHPDLKLVGRRRPDGRGLRGRHSPCCNPVVAGTPQHLLTNLVGCDAFYNADPRQPT